MTSPKAVNSGQTEREAFAPPQTFAGFAAAHVNVTGHMPSQQEAFDAGVRAGLARAAAPQGLTDERIDMLGFMCATETGPGTYTFSKGALLDFARALLANQSPAPASPSGEDAAEQSAATMADDVEDDDIQPTPESERAAFNAMMRWHLIRLLQAWRYGGDLRAAGMAAFEWARSNDVGKAAFEASDRAVKLSADLPRASEQADEAVTLPEAFKSPLTSFGLLVRALRIVAGTTLYDMAKALSSTPATLSAVECGRKPLTEEMVIDTYVFFTKLGVHDTLYALDAARAKDSK